MDQPKTDTAASVVDQGKALWAKMSARKKIAAAAAIALPLILVAYLSLAGSTGDWAVLYSGLSPEDAGELVAELKRREVPYRLAAGGTVVEVPESQVHEMRIATASAGLPRGGAGVGFEIFDEQSFGTSSFVEQVNYGRALQGELSRSVAALAAVDSARVHVAVGKRSVFRDADEPPSASVALRLRPGRRLSDEQVRGIVNLVASSVAGLDTDRVVVIDQAGNVLSTSSEDVRAGAQTDLEGTLAARIRSMLERVVGPGRAAVTVTAAMDYRKIEATEELYDQKDPAVRSESRTVEGNTGQIAAAGVGGVAGARGNLPGAQTAGGASGGGVANAGGNQRLSETRNYEINRVIRKTIEPEARVKRLHVAVLVDYDRDEEGKPIARSAESLAELTAIARESAGINTERGDRIEVRSVPFVAPANADLPAATSAQAWPLPVPMPIALGGAAGLLVLIALVVLLVRRRKNKDKPEVIQLPAPVSDIEAVLDGEFDPKDPLGLATPSLHNRVLEAVKTDPQRAARVVSAWLNQAPAEQKENAA